MKILTHAARFILRAPLAGPAAAPAAPSRNTPATAVAMLFIGLLSLQPASGLDFGGNLNSSTGLVNDNPTFSNTASAFLRYSPAVEPGSLNLSWLIEGSVTSRVSRADNGDWDDTLTGDLGLARAIVLAPAALGPRSTLRTTFGRTTYVEPTTLIFAERVDGATIDLNYPRFGITLGAGYTGLLARENSSIRMSLDDFADSDYFASPRIVTGAALRAPALFARQTVTTGAVAQWDVRGDTEFEEINSQYVFSAVEGPVTRALSYNGSFAVSRAVSAFSDNNGEFAETDPVLGLSAGLEAEYYLGPAEQSRIAATARWISGDSLDTAADAPGDHRWGRFTPIAPGSPQLLHSPGRSDLTLAKLDYSVRPFAGAPGARARSLEAGAYAAGTFAADLSDSDAYRGLETGAQVTARPFSELGARAWLAGFFPGDSDLDNDLYARFELSTSF